MRMINVFFFKNSFSQIEKKRKRPRPLQPTVSQFHGLQPPLCLSNVVCNGVKTRGSTLCTSEQYNFWGPGPKCLAHGQVQYPLQSPDPSKWVAHDLQKVHVVLFLVLVLVLKLDHLNTNCATSRSNTTTITPIHNFNL